MLKWNERPRHTKFALITAVHGECILLLRLLGASYRWGDVQLYGRDRAGPAKTPDATEPVCLGNDVATPDFPSMFLAWAGSSWYR